MTVRSTPWPAGTPCWVDLSTTDPAAAREFYTTLFGWQLEVGGDEVGQYANALLDGEQVCGINGVPMGQAAWTTYLATDDAAAGVRAIDGAGGSVVMAPMQVMDNGTMALAEAPGGGFFGLWQSGTHVGFGRANEPGTDIWNEFLTRDYASAQAFFAEVAGFTYTEIGDENFRYSTVAVGGETVGGLGQLGPDADAETPPHWRVYFAVAHADAAVERVVELGGTIVSAAQDMPFGRFAEVADAQGARFAVVAAQPTQGE